MRPWERSRASSQCQAHASTSAPCWSARTALAGSRQGVTLLAAVHGAPHTAARTLVGAPSSAATLSAISSGQLLARVGQVVVDRGAGARPSARCGNPDAHLKY